MPNEKEKSKKIKEKSARKWIKDVYTPWYNTSSTQGDGDEGTNPPGGPPPPPPVFEDDDD